MYQNTLCTLNYHTLHPGVTFAIMFDKIILHVPSTCFLLRWNKLFFYLRNTHTHMGEKGRDKRIHSHANTERLKHHSSKLIKTKANFSHISLSRMCTSPKFRFFSKPHVSLTSLIVQREVKN